MRKVIILFLVCASFLWAQKPKSIKSIKSASFGNLVWGNGVGKISSVVGRPVIVKAWGTAFLKLDGADDFNAAQYVPEIAKLYKKYKKKGVVVISVHVPFGSEKDLSKHALEGMVWRHASKAKLPFPVYRGANIKFKDVPRVLLFDVKGKLIVDDDPGSGLNKVKKYLKTSPYWLFERKKVRKIYPVAKIAARGKNLGKVYTKLQKMSEKEGEKGEQAQYLMERIGSYFQKEKDKINHMKTKDPYGTLVLYKEFFSTFRGHPELKEIQKDYAELKKNRAAKAAFRLRNQILELYYNLKPAKYGGDVDLSNPKCYRKNRKSLAKMRKSVAIMKKRYSETPYWPQIQTRYTKLMESRKK